MSDAEWSAAVSAGCAEDKDGKDALLKEHIIPGKKRLAQEVHDAAQRLAANKGKETDSHATQGGGKQPKRAKAEQTAE